MSKSREKDRIFVVDDEQTIAMTLGLILSQQGFDVTPFTDPLEALRAAQTKAPDLLIADVVMPELSGIDLAILTRETCPDCAVILFSGHNATTEMLETARARGHDFEVLPKPFHPIDMLWRVRSGLGTDSRPEESTAGFQSQ